MNLLLGLFLAGSPWVFGYSTDIDHTEVSVIIGASIMLFGALSYGATLRAQRSGFV